MSLIAFSLAPALTHTGCNKHAFGVFHDNLTPLKVRMALILNLDNLC
jgi:hypothetical protein